MGNRWRAVNPNGKRFGHEQMIKAFIEDGLLPLFWAWLLLGTQVLWPLLWWWQKRPGATGGPISWVKAGWLVFVINLWFVVPLALWEKGLLWSLLFGSMLVRGAIELPLCAKGKWRTNYGIGHDAFHLLLAGLFLFQGGIPTLWLILTALTLLCEIGFVFLFKRVTKGPEEGVFFVPDGQEYRKVNILTALVLLPTYGLFMFMLVKSLR